MADRMVRDIGQSWFPGVLCGGDLEYGRLEWGQTVGKGKVFKVGKREER